MIKALRSKFRMFYRTLWRNYNCGMWTGYPKCCVMWHTFVFSPLGYSDIFFEKKAHPIQEFAKKYLSGQNKSPNLGRIPCPYCRKFGKKSEHKTCQRHTLCSSKLFERTKRVK